MTRPVALVALLLGMALCTVSDRLRADEVRSQEPLPRGTQAISFQLAKAQKIPDGVVPGAAIDVVSDISKPIETGIALLNVKVLAIDAKVEGGPTVTVRVTPNQVTVLLLMQKDGSRLGIKLREKDQPKK